MLMHAAMDHSGHQSSDHPVSTPQSSMTTATGVRQCAHCGFSLQPGFAFCPNCGMRLKTVQCPACGQKVDPAWSACAYCGSPLGEAEKESMHH